MMKFKFLLTTLFSILTFAANAHVLFDSVGVENLNGKKVILHKLDPKDNFYSIARHYNVTPKSVIQFNPGAKMSIGVIVKVPTERPFDEAVAAKAVTPQPVQKPVVNNNTATIQKSVAPVNNTFATTAEITTTQYKVAASETLYAISKRFNTTVEDLIKTNNLKSNNLTPGQVLQVKANQPSVPVVQTVAIVTPSAHTADNTTVVKVTTVTPPPPVVAKRDTTVVASNNTDSARIPVNRYGLNEKNEKGVAVWTDKDDLDPTKKLVLHRTAPVGTVVKITNPMTNRTTFAKVVGRFTENENTKDVIMVMTKNVAESLGALDKRFRVNISYGVAND